MEEPDATRDALASPDLDPPDGAPGDASGWVEAAGRVLTRYLRRAVVSGSIGALILGVAAYQVETLVMTVTLGLFAVAALLSLVFFPASVLDEMDASRHATRQRELLDAIERLGAPRPKPYQLVTHIGLRHILRDSSAMVLVAVLVEALLLLPISGYLALMPDRSIVYSLVFIFTSVLAVALPAFIFSMIFFGADKKANAESVARAERVYREAVKDRAQLAGSLALDEHVGASSGGELTVQVEAGGLEVKEEVELGFSEAPQDLDEVEHEHTAHEASQ